MGQATEHVLAVFWSKRVARHDCPHGRQRVGRALVAGVVQVVGEIVMPTLAVIRRNEGLPSNAVVQCEMACHFPTILNVRTKVRLPWIQKAFGAAGEAGW